MSKQEQTGWTALIILLGIVCCGSALAQTAASQPVLIDDPVAILALFGGWGPAFVVGLLQVALFIERHFAGCFGAKTTAFLGGFWGVALTTVLTAAATAGMATYSNGWAALERSCGLAVLIAGFHVLAQLPLNQQVAKG